MDALRFKFWIFLAAVLVVIGLGSVGFMVVEDLTLYDAFYFSVVTVATVGYGDIHPVTQAGKILAILLIIMGVGTFLGVVAGATEMMLNRREKKSRLRKVNMIVGVFFSQIGTKLLTFFSDHDPHLDSIRKDLIVESEWSESDFAVRSRRLSKYSYGINIREVDLEGLRGFLDGNVNALFRLLENQNLFEHESFADLVRAILHVKEKLACRGDLGQLPDTDLRHISEDITRAYSLLVLQWLDYMRHLKDNYPFLFSLAMRTNPFDQNASPFVT